MSNPTAVNTFGAKFSVCIIVIIIIFRFVWNSFLLEPLRKNLISERWFVEIVHGYVRQEYIFLPIGRISLTIIGRRSTKYAGTRFLKRGANPTGNVANYVETEQIVWDMASSGNVADGRFSSFVQMRGSVPMRWSQDPSTRGVVGKPLILIDNHEPHAQTAASHFRDVRNKYGNPIVIMNLIKRNEKRRHEGVLHTQFLKNIEYLNQFLPNEEKLCYISFDVARCNKAANSMPSINVLNVMEDLSMKSILKNGWFQSFPLSEALKIRPREAFATLDAHHSKDGRFMIQHGICRTNCVDCLDRTNVAQFVIAKVALGCQLCAMGILDEPNLTLQSEVCRLLEDMFDEHGDTMALQYAGSQLVHSIKVCVHFQMFIFIFDSNNTFYRPTRKLRHFKKEDAMFFKPYLVTTVILSMIGINKWQLIYFLAYSVQESLQ